MFSVPNADAELRSALSELKFARKAAQPTRTFHPLSKSSVKTVGDGLLVSGPGGDLLAHQYELIDLEDTFTLHPGSSPEDSYATVHRGKQEIAVVNAGLLGLWPIWSQLELLSKTGDIPMEHTQVEKLGRLVGLTVIGLRKGDPTPTYVSVPGVAAAMPGSWSFFDECGEHLANLTINESAGFGTLLPESTKYLRNGPQNLTVDGPWRAQALRDLINITNFAASENARNGVKTLNRILDTIDITGLAKPARTPNERLNLIYNALREAYNNDEYPSGTLIELTAQIGKDIVSVDVSLADYSSTVQIDKKNKTVRFEGALSVYLPSGKVGLPVAEYTLSRVGANALQLTEVHGGELFLTARDIDAKPLPSFEL